MADPRFYDSHGPFSVADIEKLTGAQYKHGPSDRAIEDVGSLESALPGQLTFCSAPKYADQLRASKASAFLVSERLMAKVPEGATCLVVQKPQLAFAQVAAALYPDAGLFWPAAHPPTALIDPSAKIGTGSVIAPGVSLGRDAEIGANCGIGFNTVIGRGVRIGDDARIGPNVSLSNAILGDRVTIHSGCGIGQDGFGFVEGVSTITKMPQLGRVIIGNDVEIGANSAIDRGALMDTIIGNGTKIDNLVQIGHNTTIGQYSVLVSQVGVSGSCTIGDYVLLLGQVGVADHLTIGSRVTVAGQSGVADDLAEGERYGGSPAQPMALWKRDVGALRQRAAEYWEERAKKAATGKETETAE